MLGLFGRLVPHDSGTKQRNARRISVGQVDAFYLAAAIARPSVAARGTGNAIRRQPIQIRIAPTGK